METSTEESTKMTVRPGDIIPMWSVWRNTITKVVWILVRKEFVTQPYKVLSVTMLNPRREQTDEWSYTRLVDDINEGRLVRIIQK